MGGAAGGSEPGAQAAKAIDLRPLLAVQPALWPQCHFTQPFLRHAYVAISLDPEFMSGPRLGRGKRVGVLAAPLARRLAAAFPGAEVVGYATREEAATALCVGRVDAMSAEARAIQHLTLQRSPECECAAFHTMGLDSPSTEMAIAAVRVMGSGPTQVGMVNDVLDLAQVERGRLNLQRHCWTCVR